MIYNLQFREQSALINNLVNETLNILDKYSDKQIKSLIEDFNNFWNDHIKQPKLTISFIGQYNAGKSTLIKALTGNSNIAISPEICTDKVSEYLWKEVLLVDTPGIYAGREDHDEITLEKISRSDLLVFVLPNELFNPQGGDFFKRVAKDMQRVGQMVLVINKMSRESGEKTELLKSIIPVIEPYHPQDFHICFIDADSYLQAQQEKDQEEKEFLIEESNFDKFLDSLQILIDKNQLTAKLVTPLHQLVDLLEKSSNFLTTDDQFTSNLLELLRRKENILKESYTRARNIYLSTLNQLEHNIIMIGEQVATKIDGHHNEEEIKQEINNSEQEIYIVSEQIVNNITSEIELEVSNLQSKLEQLGDSPLARQIAIELQDKKKIKEYDFKSSNNSYFYGKVATNTFKNIGNFASKATRDIVYSVGKNLGIKFKPFGAFKAAKTIRGLGPIFAGLGFALDFLVSTQEEKEERDFEQKIMNVRGEIRKDYQNLAKEIKNDYEIQVSESIKFYDEELWDIELKRNELINSDKNKKNMLQEVEQQLIKIKRIIRDFS